jgi:hypothetical protein
MCKFKKWKQLKIGNYFRELSIVIIGVAITLYVSNVISEVKERKDLKLQLNAVYSELEDNLVRIDDLIEHNNKIEKFKAYVTEYYYHPEQSIVDSIRKNSGIIGRTYSYIYKRGAYDMFMNSGAMKLFNDKELLLDITECYAMMESTKAYHESYESLKLDLVRKLYDYDTKFIMADIDLTNPMYRGIYNFHISASPGGSVMETKEQIEKVLSNRERNKRITTE